MNIIIVGDNLIMMKTKHTLIENFKFAFDGIKVGFAKGRNMKIMTFMGLAALLTGLLLEINLLSWGILVITIAAVLGLELMNTALEAVVDLVSPDFNEKAKIAKDMAAGSVLVASVASVIIGCLIFLPKIL